MEKRKSGLSVLVGIGRKKLGSGGDDGAKEAEAPESSDDMGEESGLSDKEDMAISDLAETIGVPDHERENFASSFKAAVRACYEQHEDDESESEEPEETY